MAEKIGLAVCPVCDTAGAKVSLSKSNLPVLTCTACSVQIFSRGDKSDEKIRARLIVEKPAEAAPPATPPAVQQVAPEKPKVPKAKALPPEPPPAPAAKPRKGTGTAFDQLLGLG